MLTLAVASIGGILGLLVVVVVVYLLSMGAVAGAIPTPQDDSLLLQDTVTKTATFNSAGLDLGTGFTPGGRGQQACAVIDVSAIDRTSGDETYTFKLQQSSDNSTFADCGVACASLTATGVIAVDGIISQEYVRLVMTAGGTTPSITYKAWLNFIPAQR